MRGELSPAERKQENPAGNVKTECLDLSKCIECSILWDASEEIGDTLVRRTRPSVIIETVN